MNNAGAVDVMPPLLVVPKEDLPNHRSLLAVSLAALAFYLPNFLFFILFLRMYAWWLIIAYDAVIIFLLTGAVANVRFKI